MGNVSHVKAKTFTAVSADTTAICANQTNSGSGSMTLTDTGAAGVLVPGNLGTTVTIISTTGTTNAGITFDVTGMDINGDSASQTAITGPAGSATVTTTQVFVSVTSITHSGTCTDVSCGITATTTGTGVVFAGRTRIRGMHIVPSSAEGIIDFKNGSSSGTKVLEMGVYTDQTPVDPYIPDNGVLFKDGAMVNIGATDLADNITVFYDG
ncbi:uncharacterized protein METZ01_LOCUS177517 [marine metagenome]|uniref:Uncharacterized protein n=1 Tax=marine metagenome TaxID=408172 RepID=A0A382CH18_9ZZZZ